MDEIPVSHPRYKSLVIREKMKEYALEGIVAMEGLIAHGRGEAFDYIFGEKTLPYAIEAEKVAIAYLLNAKNPVISVNGNVAALAHTEIVEFNRISGIKVEINLFHRSEERIKKIQKLLETDGLEKVYGLNNTAEIPFIGSRRRFADREGIYSADVVFIPLEDGDRAQALKKMGKIVISIDLNPFSRTTLSSDVSIVDELTRAINNLTSLYIEMKNMDKKTLDDLIKGFNNVYNRKQMVNYICKKLNDWNGREYNF
ncbi:MAG: phosphopantothenate/pantothenate synthetase [Thermoplasmata archaeon]